MCVSGMYLIKQRSVISADAASVNFSYSEGRDDGSFTTRIAKLVASTGKVKLNKTICPSMNGLVSGIE